MGKAVAVLRDKNDMRKRLQKVSTDMDFDVWLYPMLLAKAGEQRSSHGLATTVAIAINEFGKKIPRGKSNRAFEFAEEFIEALTRDSQVAQEAKAHFRTITGAAT